MTRRHFKSRRRISQNELLTRLPFIIAVIVGGGVLSVLKLYNVQQLIVSLVAIIFIILYAISVIMVPTLRLREDQLGDNCYYLGFLYTLGSLVWALRSFALSNDTKQIISNFGLALFSTIVGIMLRVVINQSRKDILETERECRIELSSAVARMRSIIDEATHSLDSFCRIVQQQAEESIANTVEKSSNAILSCSNDMMALNAKIIEGVSNSFENHEKLAQRISNSVNLIEAELNSVSERLNSIEIDKNLINIKMDPVINQVESSLNKVTDIIKKHSESMMALSETLISGINKLLASQENQAQKIHHAVSAIEGELFKVSNKLNQVDIDKNLINVKIEPYIAPVATSLNELADTFKEHNNSLLSEMKRSKTITLELATTLTDLANLISERVR